MPLTSSSACFDLVIISCSGDKKKVSLCSEVYIHRRANQTLKIRKLVTGKVDRIITRLWGWNYTSCDVLSRKWGAHARTRSSPRVLLDPVSTCCSSFLVSEFLGTCSKEEKKKRRCVCYCLEWSLFHQPRVIRSRGWTNMTKCRSTRSWCVENIAEEHPAFTRFYNTVDS